MQVSRVKDTDDPRFASGRAAPYVILRSMPPTDAELRFDMNSGATPAPTAWPERCLQMARHVPPASTTLSP